jgi:hypothetical protein
MAWPREEGAAARRRGYSVRRRDSPAQQGEANASDAPPAWRTRWPARRGRELTGPATRGRVPAACRCGLARIRRASLVAMVGSPPVGASSISGGRFMVRVSLRHDAHSSDLRRRMLTSEAGTVRARCPLLKLQHRVGTDSLCRKCTNASTSRCGSIPLHTVIGRVKLRRRTSP